MANLLAVARRVSLQRANSSQSVILGGQVYRLYTWDALERDARAAGISVTYHGTEVRLEDDGTELLFRIFSLTKTGAYTAVQVAVPA